MTATAYTKHISNEGSLTIDVNGNGTIDFETEYYDQGFASQISHSFSIEELEELVKKAKDHQIKWNNRETVTHNLHIGDSVTVSNGRNANTGKIGKINARTDKDAFIDFGTNIRTEHGDSYPDAYWCNLKFITKV